MKNELPIRIRRNFSFSMLEVRHMLIIVAILALFLGFDDGRPDFVLPLWLWNMFTAFLIVLLSVMLHLTMIKIVALFKGYPVKFKMFLYGIGGGALFGLASLGRLPLFAPYELEFSLHEGYRLGRWRMRMNYNEMATAAIAGPLMSLIMAIFFKLLYQINPSFVILNAIRMNVFLAVGTMLPIPKIPGGHVIYSSIGYYAFAMTLVCGIGISLMFINVIPALLFGIGIAVMAGLAIFFKYDYH